MDDKEEKKEKRSNAENNRAYRLRKGVEINARRREQRNKEKAIVNVKIEYEGKELKKAKRLPERVEGKEIGEATKNKYIGYIKNFYKRYTGEELKEGDDIIMKIEGKKYKAINISRIFKVIINENLGEIKGSATDTGNIYSIFRGIRGFTEIAKELYPYLKDYAEQYEEKRSIIVGEDIEISFILEDIVKNIERIEGKEDKIIYGYLMIMNGRVHDLRYTRIAKDKEETKNEGYNYIYEGKYYINNTKNKKKGIIEIGEEFARLYEGMGEGYLLGRLLPSSTIAKRIERITKYIYGRIYTSSNIRHLHATYINKKGSDYKERKESAARAGHSIEQQIKYSYKVV
jgi:hypothetical protein